MGILFIGYDYVCIYIYYEKKNLAIYIWYDHTFLFSLYQVFQCLGAYTDIHATPLLQKDKYRHLLGFISSYQLFASSTVKKEGQKEI